MKMPLLLSAIALCSVPVVKGQTFTSQSQEPYVYHVVYSQPGFAGFHYHHRICGVAKAGGITASAGFLCTIGGLSYIIVTAIEEAGDASTHDINTGITMMKIGGGLAVAGMGLGIAGFIHDKSNRWSVVTPKKDQVGLAYNFK